jgi:pimeloyl-ACP methyl ester carboxylesterase
MSMSRWAPILLTLPLYSGCAMSPGRTAPASPPLPVARATGVVFCADGAGGFGGTTQVLEHVIAEARVPLRVEMVDWSHGTGRYLADHLHWSNIEKQGRHLAAQTQAWRRRYPDKPVYYVGQSAGCAVVLVAAETLPQGGVDRVVLLAPSVSTDYDLRPALARSRQGIDVFYSHKDWFVLGLGMAFSGTTDRRLAPAAGRVGFRPIITEPRDKELYAGLRQHAWDPSVSWTGNTGGHYGHDEPGHIRARILPLLTPPAARTSGEP